MSTTTTAGETEDEKQTNSSMNTNSSIARWDISVNAATVEYGNNERTAQKTGIGYHTTIRTVFLKRGRHIFNIKVEHLGHVGLGICGANFEVCKDQWIGSTPDSYGTWDNIAAYNNGAPLKQNLKTEIKIKKDDIVKIDLDLNDRTFAWEINGQRLTTDVKIGFSGPVAIAGCLYHPHDMVDIVQYYSV